MSNPEIITQIVIQKIREPEGTSYHLEISGNPTLREKQELLRVAEIIIQHQVHSCGPDCPFCSQPYRYSNQKTK